MVGIVAGFGIRVYAQTSATEFRDPTCNPNDPTGPSGCNTSSPLFLAPSDKTTAQVVQTPVYVGQSTANKKLQVLGNLLLGETPDPAPGVAYSLQRAAQAGQAINVYSTDTFAIVAKTDTGAAALQASATAGTGDAIQATSVGGRGIYALGSPAGQFQGNVDIIGGGNLTVAGTTTLTGNVNIVGTLQVGGAAVGAVANSIRDQNYPSPSGGVYERTFDVSNVGPTGKLVDFTNSVSPDYVQITTDNTFHIVGLDVMYDADTTAPNIFWRPAVDATNFAEYRECSSGVFYGKLYLQTANANTKVRVSLRYRDEAAVCGAPNFTLAVDPTGNGYTSNFNFTTSAVTVTGTATYAWDFGEDALNDVDCQSTDPNATCVNAGGFVFAGTVANPTVRYPSGVTSGVKSPKLTISDDVGPPGTTKSVNINMFRPIFSVAQRSELTQFVNITDSTNYGGITGVSCRVDLLTDGSNDITPAAGTNCSDTTNTVVHVFNTTYTETMRLFHPTCPGPTNECASYTRPVVTRNTCMAGGPCGPGRSCCNGTITCTVGSKVDTYPAGCYNSAPSSGCVCGSIIGGDVTGPTT